MKKNLDRTLFWIAIGLWFFGVAALAGDLFFFSRMEQLEHELSILYGSFLNYALKL